MRGSGNSMRVLITQSPDGKSGAGTGFHLTAHCKEGISVVGAWTSWNMQPVCDLLGLSLIL